MDDFSEEATFKVKDEMKQTKNPYKNLCSSLIMK